MININEVIGHIPLEKLNPIAAVLCSQCLGFNFEIIKNVFKFVL